MNEAAATSADEHNQSRHQQQKMKPMDTDKKANNNKRLKPSPLPTMNKDKANTNDTIKDVAAATINDQRRSHCRPRTEMKPTLPTPTTTTNQAANATDK